MHRVESVAQFLCLYVGALIETVPTCESAGEAPAAERPLCAVRSGLSTGRRRPGIESQ
jgi:hypothetical protein